MTVMRVSMLFNGPLIILSLPLRVHHHLRLPAKKLAASSHWSMYNNLFQPYGFPSASAGSAAFYPTTAVVDSVRKSQEQVSAATLSRALQMCNSKMVKAETLILEGDPKDSICEVSEEMNTDLFIVGSRGLGKIKRAFLGSVSYYCAHHAKCPTLIVKPPKEASNK